MPLPTSYTVTVRPALYISLTLVDPAPAPLAISQGALAFLFTTAILTPIPPTLFFPRAIILGRDFLRFHKWNSIQHIDLLVTLYIACFAGVHSNNRGMCPSFPFPIPLRV